MYMAALRESRKLRAAEEKVQWDLLVPKKVTGLENFGLTTIYCVFNHRGFGASQICLAKAGLEKQCFSIFLTGEKLDEGRAKSNQILEGGGNEAEGPKPRF